MRVKTLRPGHESGHVGALLALVTTELLGVAALHRLGRVPGLAIDWRHLGAWASTGPVEDVLAASLRLAALACAYWLLLSTVLYVTARLAHLPSLARAMRWATLPALRRLADRALAVALVGSTVTGGAGVAWASDASPSMAPPIVLGVDESPAPPGLQPPRPPTPVPSPVPSFDLLPVPTPPSHLVPPPVVAPPMSPGALVPPGPERSHEVTDAVNGADRVQGEASNPPPEGARQDVHVVVRGDNLWRIAAATSRRRHGREVTNRDIAAYWRLVMRANRNRLRSGDPDLIFPGEQVLLPPQEAGQGRSGR